MVCNQSEEKYTYGDAIHATRDYIRLTAITYQFFGLDKKRTKQLLRSFFGAARQTRTADLILTKDVLYHLSHNSIADNVMYFTIISSRCQEQFLKNLLFLKLFVVEEFIELFHKGAQILKLTVNAGKTDVCDLVKLFKLIHNELTDGITCDLAEIGRAHV